MHPHPPHSCSRAVPHDPVQMTSGVHVPGPPRYHVQSSHELGQDSYAGNQRTSQDPEEKIIKSYIIHSVLLVMRYIMLFRNTLIDF